MFTNDSWETQVRDVIQDSCFTSVSYQELFDDYGYSFSGRLYTFVHTVQVAVPRRVPP